MGSEEKPKYPDVEKFFRKDYEPRPSDMVEMADALTQVEAELESGEFAPEPEYEEVPFTNEAMEALSDEQLDEQINLIHERMENNKQRRELDRRALNLGLLRLANQAKRCSHLKSNGKPCRAPAMGNNLFCVFHVRALETNNYPVMTVDVLENRQSLQIAVKQIMERIVNGVLKHEDASLLLRAVQIANSTLNGKARSARIKKKAPRSEARGK